MRLYPIHLNKQTNKQKTLPNEVICTDKAQNANLVIIS